MIATLSRRERTIVALGVAAVVLVGGWELVAQPLVARNQMAAELVPVREQVLVRRLDLLTRRSAITAELEAATRRVEETSARLLTSAAPAVAASELQKIFKEMAGQAGTEIRSERILSPAERGELLEIPIEVAVFGEIRQLVDLLARLETSQKMLTVQELRVRVVNVSRPKELLTTLTLSGFIRPGKAKT